MKNFLTCLLLISSACKSDEHAPSEPSVPKPVERAPAPVAAPLPKASTDGAQPDLKGIQVGSSADDVDALMQKDDHWIAERACDSCADGDYLYGDVDDPQVTITVKKDKVVSIIEHSFAAISSVANEPVGPLKLDMNRTLVEKALGKPAKTTALTHNGEYDRFESQWSYPDQGVSLRLATKTQKGMLRVAAISVTAPSTLKTKRGIGIGSSRAEANKAYADAMADEADLDPSMWIAGGTVGGSVELAFTDDKVSEISISVSKGE